MAEVVFRGPAGKWIKNPDLALIGQLFLSPPPDFWRQGAGDAMIEFVDVDVSKKLLVLPNEQFEIYLKYLEGGKTWLSLEDPQN